MKSILLCLVCLGAFAASFCLADSPSPFEVANVFARASKIEPGASLEPCRRIEDWLRASVRDDALRRNLLEQLAKLAGPHSTFEARRFACTQIAIHGGAEALPVLSGLLESQETAGMACLALTTYPQGKADDLLRDALSKTKGRALVQIVQTLGDRRDPKAIPMLREIAQGPDPEAVNAAVAALGKIGNAKALSVLEKLTKATPPLPTGVVEDAMLTAAAALVKAGNQADAKRIYSRYTQPGYSHRLRQAAFSALLHLDRDGGEKRIMEALNGSDRILRPAAIQGIRQVKTKGASERFSVTISKLSDEEKVWMIGSLEQIGDAGAVHTMQDLLKAEQEIVRIAAAAALGRCGNAGTVPQLTAALIQTTTAEEMKALESALITLRGAEVTQRITIEFQRSQGGARARLLNVLAMREGPAAVDLYLKEANSTDSALARAAYRALARTAGPGQISEILQQLTGALNREVRSEAESACSKILAQMDNEKVKSDALQSALARATIPEAQASLIRLLPLAGDERSLAAIERALGDSNDQVKSAAREALADWPNLRAWGLLMTTYTSSSDPALSNEALTGMVRLAAESNTQAPPGMTARYQALLAEAKSNADMKLMLGALGGLAEPEALDLALSFLDRQGVQAEAKAAVKRISESIRKTHPEAAAKALAKVGSQ